MYSLFKALNLSSLEVPNLQRIKIDLHSSPSWQCCGTVVMCMDYRVSSVGLKSTIRLHHCGFFSDLFFLSKHF